MGSNALCIAIDFSGIYDCTNPLTGTYIELRRTDITIDFYVWAEIRAYEHKPFALTTSMMSSNYLLNTSFVNALSFSMTKGTTGTEALTNDAYFNGNNCPAANCFLKVDFGASLDIKAVLVVGIPYTTESVNWTMRLGDSSDSAMNTDFWTAGINIYADWAKEILVNSRGRYMDII